MKKNALSVTREDDFSAWYQQLIAEADLAEESGVRGCMVMRPWGYGIWERVQFLMDQRIKATGHENCYFPLFIPLSYFAKEAEHVDGFAKEMAVVTHHRLMKDDADGLVVDPEAKLEEPLVVRPTSETVIGTAFSRWVQSWRDLPVMINQWANVVRWEMRTRMFLRTSEFLWQEGHTAHATRDEAMEETLEILEMYRSFSEDVLAMPVVAGEKPENERFPGADATYSIEAMMQDGKALQAGTSHFLGQTFSKAQNIRYQDKEGQFQFAYTTSWGTSTRLIGGVIMTHGDDDGLRVPPLIAPYQVVIIPMLRDKPEDEAVLEFCSALTKQLSGLRAFDENVRVKLDKSGVKASNKRWAWVKKGAPIILEIGPRDVSEGNVSALRRDALYKDNGKLDSQILEKDVFAEQVPALLEEIQTKLHGEARQRLDANITRGLTDFADVEKFYKENKKYPGWLEVQWCRATGEELDQIEERLKKLKLTFRNVPTQAAAVDGDCIFTGKPAVERILIGKAY
ncbi:proline--tRNA ligase [Parasphingorhabdus litoris]|uniref:Proline--tRNA ligase n=1 Tax=Parasphingorhabdus litoris TaxID=394733 RepID=A0ABN1ARK9_9SPHN|nr:proline--tRNA ligase [Parasphingorhabdus litoris]